MTDGLARLSLGIPGAPLEPLLGFARPIGMDNDPTPAEVDALYSSTQPIGDAIREHIAAGLAATTPESNAETAAWIGLIVQAVMDPAGSWASATRPRSDLQRPVIAGVVALSQVVDRLPAMRTWDFWTERTIPGLDPWGNDRTERNLNTDILQSIAKGPLADHPDIEVAVALAHFCHEEFEAYGTEGHQITQDDSILVVRALNAVLGRLGITTFDLPFRDFNTFHKHWKRVGASGGGGWQARRDILDEHFEPLHKELIAREAGSITSALATAISPHKVTGWPRVDEEISELRRHFETASTQQDYSNVGNDCVSTLEALSAAVYDHARHQDGDKDEPPVDKTKIRFDRYIDVELVGANNAELRKLARATVEVAQAVKHRRSTITRTEAGIASDAVILVANMLRRIRPD